MSDILQFKNELILTNNISVGIELITRSEAAKSKIDRQHQY